MEFVRSLAYLDHRWILPEDETHLPIMMRIEEDQLKAD